MKKNKTALLIIIFAILLSVILYFLPLKSILGNLPLLNRFYNNTSIEILTQNGKAKVWINGEDYGETPMTVEDLAEGSYTIEMEKIEEEKTFYEKHSFQIYLTRNTSARIDMEIGPSDLLNGYILYYTEIKASEKKGFLTTTSSVEKTKVFLDKEYIKTTPITNLPLTENQYQIKISAQGYEDVELPVLVRKNYSLNLKTYHFPIPTAFDTLEESNE